MLFEIVQEIKTAKFYSILADEVTSHNTEHLALCTCFVDAKGDTREEFMTFLSQCLTGRYIAEKIIKFLKDNDLPVENTMARAMMVSAICPLSVWVFKHKYKKCLHLQHISTAVPIN